MVYTDFITGNVDTEAGTFPRVATRWSRIDRWNTLKIRWSVGRMKYRVMPGIYAVGNPHRNSYVFVTANYKLSFDHLRRALEGMDAWILVIDTKGINVWCAAGKGTFSTKEVVRRIRIHHVDQLVDHRRLILPQLSATGVSAHEVKRMTGFSVVYGPVKASGISSFVEKGLRADEAMRRVTFPMVERLKLIPVDMFYAKYLMLIIPAVFIALSGIFPGGYSFGLAGSSGWKATVNLFAGYLSGCVLTPVLLPWIPLRRFSLKGLVTGLLVSLALAVTGMLGSGIAEIASWTLMITGLSSFMAMNFTGSSTYTSLSGVQKEMKSALPLQISMVSLGFAGWIITKFIVL